MEEKKKFNNERIWFSLIFDNFSFLNISLHSLFLISRFFVYMYSSVYCYRFTVINFVVGVVAVVFAAVITIYVVAVQVRVAVIVVVVVVTHMTRIISIQHLSVLRFSFFFYIMEILQFVHVCNQFICSWVSIIMLPNHSFQFIMSHNFDCLLSWVIASSRNCETVL